MRVVLLGPPGAGKGTQGRLLAEKFHLRVLGMGDLLRAQIKEGTEVGKQIAPLLEKGEFPSSKLVSEVLFHELERCERFLVDGYPRDEAQAFALDEFLGNRKKTSEKRNETLTHALFLDVAQEALLERLQNRYMCVKCGAPYAKTTKEPQTKGVCDFCQGTEFAPRPDDHLAVAQERIKKAQERDKIVLEYYQKKGILHKVDGSQGVSQVAEDLARVLGAS